MISFRQIDTSDVLYPQVFRLREEVLRAPLGLSLRDEDLSSDVHDKVFIALDENDTVIACLMMHRKGAGLLKMRQMAVEHSQQGKGIGFALVKFAESVSADSGCRMIELHARSAAGPFYEKLGYIRTGDLFTEVGIPHVRMEKSL